MSLDGVFDANTMPEWYLPYDSEARQRYIRDGILSADAFLMGRVTYEMLFPYWSTLKNNEMGVAAKLNSGPKFVVSSTLDKASWNNTTIIKSNVVENIKQLKAQPGAEIRIDGSATLVRSLMDTGLVDEYRFLVHPVIAGKGLRFFKEGKHPNPLKLIKNVTLDKDVVLLCYTP